MHGVFIHVPLVRLMLLTAIVMGCVIFERPHFARAGEPAPIVIADMKNKKDRATIRDDPQSTFVSITSPSGIGEAVIRRATNNWPKQVVLRFHLRGLEQVSIRNAEADVTLRGSVLSHGNHRRKLELVRDKTLSRVGQGSPYSMKIEAFQRQGCPAQKIPLDEGYFQMKIPAAMLKGNPERLSIRWIDFYRS